MMDAGVPLKAPVAGVAMGLILEGEKFAVLTDILGDEDHLGDMDFKVAGTANGITSLQMDIKVAGITPAIMEQALAQAKEGRMHILGEMEQGADRRRGREFSAHAPRIETMQIAVDKIREVIGSGGKVIRAIVEENGRQGRHQRRRHDQDRLRQLGGDREGARADRRHRRRAGGRQDLHRQGGEDHGLRRLRELLRQARRPGARQPALERARRAIRRTSCRKARR